MPVRKIGENKTKQTDPQPDPQQLCGQCSYKVVWTNVIARGIIAIAID